MSPDMRQRDKDQPPTPRRTALVRGISALIALGVLVLIVRDPALAGSTGTIGQRAWGAMMIVGAIGCLLRALELRGARPPVRALTHPGVAWTLALAGAAGQALG